MGVNNRFLSMKRIFCTIVALLALFVARVEAQTIERYYYPTPPASVPKGAESMEWLALHFWDDYNFASSLSTYTEDARRGAFALFLYVLPYNTPETVREAIDSFLTKASVSEDGYWDFLEMAEIALYDPNSPQRNDLLWEDFLISITGPKSPLDELSKERYRSLMEIVSRNQMGDKATDFVYTLKDGSRHCLSEVSAPLTLLYFYNPGCSECARAKGVIDESGFLEALHQRGLIEVFAIYPDGDVAEWRKHLADHPTWWTTAYDDGKVLSDKNLYDLKAIPTFYLLDEAQRVILKDPTVEVLVDVLGQYYAMSNRW